MLNTDGEVEMDAVLMDGKDLKCGAVACLQNIKNPISVARLVMDKVLPLICNSQFYHTLNDKKKKTVTKTPMDT